MSIWLRFFWVIIAGFFKKPLGFGDVSVLRQRVWLDELDINVHMNNAKYLAVMDLGRTDWIVRSGAWRWMTRDKSGDPNPVNLYLGTSGVGALLPRPSSWVSGAVET